MPDRNDVLSAIADGAPALAIAPEPAPAPIARGFGDALPCLKCGEVEGLRLGLTDLGADDAITCTHCDAEYPISEARAIVGAWARMLAWCAACPELED